MELKFKEKFGSIRGLIIMITIGFLLYALLTNIQSMNIIPKYSDIVHSASNYLPYKFAWFLMNFTDAQFYTGIFAGLGMILGGFIAYLLGKKGIDRSIFPVCYGTNLWPLVFLSQIISAGLGIFVLNYIRFLGYDYTWVPTFITIVGTPPAIVLLYGANYKLLFTTSILSGLISFPLAFWFMNTIIPVLNLPGVIGNLLTMAIIGIAICSMCKVLPFGEKVPIKQLDKPYLRAYSSVENMRTPNWFIRRVLADFSEPQFYGNELVSLFAILGVIIDFLLNSSLPGTGTGLIPSILLSQIIGSSVGVFIYFRKFVEHGWYATYVPTVSVGPACVLFFHGGIFIAVFSAVLGAIIGPPLAEFFYNKLPEDFHISIGNVVSMALTTGIVALTIKCLI